MRVNCAAEPEGTKLYSYYYRMSKRDAPSILYTVSITSSARNSSPFARLPDEEVFAILRERGLVRIYGTACEDALSGQEDVIASDTMPMMTEPKSIRRAILSSLNATRWLWPKDYRDRGLIVNHFLPAFGIEEGLLCQGVIALIEKSYLKEARGRQGNVWFMHITQRGVEAIEEASRYIFVAMPFHRDFDDVYHKGIKAACENTGFDCKRVDKEEFNHEIVQEIYNEIAKAQFVIADISRQNPCVHYEVGYTHADDRGKVIFVIDKISDAKFDVSHFNIIEYKGDVEALRKRLEQRIEKRKVQSFV